MRTDAARNQASDDPIRAVLLNGQPADLDSTVAVDTEEGWIDVWRRNATGAVRFEGEGSGRCQVRCRLYGKVEAFRVSDLRRLTEDACRRAD